MKQINVKKSLTQLQSISLNRHQCQQIKGGNGDASDTSDHTDDIVIVDIITT